MTTPNINAHLHDLAEHLSCHIEPARRRDMVAVCSCGWRSPLAKKPEGAHRMYSQMHLRPLQDAAAALRCPICHRPTGGGVCAKCQEFVDEFGEGVARTIHPGSP